MKSNKGSGHILWVLNRQQIDPVTRICSLLKLRVVVLRPSSCNRVWLTEETKESNTAENLKPTNIRVMSLTRVTPFMH